MTPTNLPAKNTRVSISSRGNPGAGKSPGLGAKGIGQICYKIWERTLQWTITSRGNQGQGNVVVHTDLGIKSQTYADEVHCERVDISDQPIKRADGGLDYTDVTFNLMKPSDNSGEWNKTLGPYVALRCKLIVGTQNGGSNTVVFEDEAEIMHERPGKDYWMGDPAAGPTGHFGGTQMNWFGYDPEDWENIDGDGDLSALPGGPYVGYGKYEQQEFISLRGKLRTAIDGITDPADRENWIFERDLVLRVPYIPPNFDSNNTLYENDLWVPRLHNSLGEPITNAARCGQVAPYCQQAPFYNWGGGQPPTVASLIPQMNFGYNKIVSSEIWDNIFHPLEMKKYLSRFITYCAHWACAYLPITPRGGNRYYSMQNGQLGPPAITAWEGLGGKVPDPAGPGWISDNYYKHMVYTNWWLIFENMGGNGRNGYPYGIFYTNQQMYDTTMGGFQAPMEILQNGRDVVAQYFPGQAKNPLNFSTNTGWRPNYLISAGVPASEER